METELETIMGTSFDEYDEIQRENAEALGDFFEDTSVEVPY